MADAARGRTGEDGPQRAPLSPGVRLAVDLGLARVGVARTDPAGILATPVATLRRDTGADGDMTEVARLAGELEAVGIYVGLPRSMDGRERAAASAVRRWAVRLSGRVAVPVRLVDERLSTVTAHRLLHEAGRAEKRHRAVVDQVAAVVILEAALDVERATGEPAGRLVIPPATDPRTS